MKRPKTIIADRSTVIWYDFDLYTPEYPKREPFGLEVLVWPPVFNQEATAYFGTRQSDVPAFYKYGAVLSSVKFWAYLPQPSVPESE